MPIYSRRQIAEHFRALLSQHPRQHAIQMTASHFGLCADQVEKVLLDAAVTVYLNEAGNPGAIALAASLFGIKPEVLQAAVDEHCESVEA